MKLLFITQKVDRTDPVLGFVEGWINALSRHLERLYVLCLAIGPHEVAENVDLHSLGKDEGLSKAYQLARFNQVLSRLCRTREIDGVLAHMCPRYAILAFPYCRVYRLPLGLWYAHRSVDGQLRIAHRLVDFVVSPTPGSFPMPSRKLYVVGHGIDLRRFRPANGPLPRTGPPRILCVGRIAPIKQQAVLVEALHLLRQSGVNADLILVGAASTPEGETYLQYLHHLTARYQMEECVHFVGPVQHDRLVDYYQQCDVFASPSSTGSLDKALLEAMACGRPVLSSNEAFAEILAGQEDRLSGLVLASVSPGVWATALARVLQLEAAPWAEVGACLRTLVIREHSLEALMERLVNVYRSHRPTTTGEELYKLHTQ